MDVEIKSSNNNSALSIASKLDHDKDLEISIVGDDESRSIWIRRNDVFKLISTLVDVLKNEY